MMQYLTIYILNDFKIYKHIYTFYSLRLDMWASFWDIKVVHQTQHGSFDNERGE